MSVRKGKEYGDGDYIVDLCDEILGQKARREETFKFLLGDPGKNGLRRALPVDAYYPELKLVIEYLNRPGFSGELLV